jgi:gamma-D-glutamyl-L-lysine dipeptidyl-peptidase
VQARLHQNRYIVSGELQDDSIKQKILALFPSEKVMDSMIVLPSSDLGANTFGIITIPVANLKSQPAHSSELASQLLAGSVVRILKKKSNWYYIQGPDDYLAWLDGDAMQIGNQEFLEAWQSASKWIITQDQAFLTDQPRPDGEIVSPLTAGMILKHKATEGKYVVLEFPDGRAGYTTNSTGQSFADWKKQMASIPPVSSLIQAARTYLGRPYLWGGTSGNAMDCSGFTKMIFFRHGYLLPRDASQQVHVGLPLDTDTSFQDLQSGDLLFFGRKATDSLPEKISHVAIYEGNGKIIHAAGLIRVQSLRRGDPDFEESRLTSFVRATRPWQAPREHGILPIADIKWYR